MRQALRAIALLSASSVAGIVIAVAYGKTRAVLIGPDGFGSMVLLQNLVSMGTIALGLGVGTAAVQVLARAGADEHNPIRLTAWFVRSASALVAVVLFAALAQPLAAVLLGDAAAWPEMAFLGLAIAFALATDLHVNTLVAVQRIAPMARATVFAGAAGSVAGAIALLLGHRAFIPIAIVVFAIGGWLATLVVSRGQAPHLSIRTPSTAQLVARTRELLKIGVPYAGSQLLSSGVLLVIPFIVLALLGRTSVGFYQAALAIGSTYPGGLINALGSDYYQRLAAAPSPSTGGVLSAMVNQQLRLVLAIGVPVIMALMALAPYVVPLAYSGTFLPAVTLLQWMLLGDLFKFASYTMSFAILARGQTIGFLITESVAGIVYVTSAYVGIRAFGLVGLGISWIITYGIYLAVVWLVARRLLGVRIASRNALLLFGGALLICGAEYLVAGNVSGLRLSGPLLLTLVAGVAGVLLLRRDLRGLLTAPRPDH